jgi:hypothetical protein
MGAQLPRPIFVDDQPFDARCAMLGVQVGELMQSNFGWAKVG